LVGFAARRITGCDAIVIATGGEFAKRQIPIRGHFGKRDQEKAVKSKTFRLVRSRESQHQPSTPSFSLNHVDRLVVSQSSLSTVSGFIR
jgi:hypothetical protein